MCINAGLRGLAPYFSFIDFPFCSGRWCESSSVITVHIGGGENDKTRRGAGGSRKGRTVLGFVCDEERRSQ